jgi:flagellar biosynthesis regulator FlbT
MEKLFKRYEHEIKNFKKVEQNYKNAEKNVFSALNTFRNKYHIPPEHITNNNHFFSLVMKHPNVKQNYRKLLEATKIRNMKRNTLMHLQRKVGQSFHIPYGTYPSQKDLLNRIRNERQRAARHQNIARMISVLKEKNVPANLIRHMFPPRSRT